MSNLARILFKEAACGSAAATLMALSSTV